jgi:ATP-dependent Clp protease ATP-binding subunit ClpX
LRSILEETMMNVMFDVPSLSGVAQCIIEEETIREKSEPTLVTRAELLAQSREAKEQEAEETLPKLAKAAA